MMTVYDQMRGRGIGPAFVALAGFGILLAQSQPAQAQAPLAHLGTNAIAVVEDVSGASGVGFMDFIFAGQSFDLGADGKLVVSYLSGCRTETIVGGKVSFSDSGASSAGGKVTSSVAANCQVASAEIAGNATEAGAVAVRGTGDLLDDLQDDRVIRSASPAFRWLAGGAGEVRIYNAGRVPAELVWTGQGENGHIEYPAAAPRLTPNIPYRVEVRSGGKVIGVARFSIDPTLTIPDTLANRLVPVAKP